MKRRQGETLFHFRKRKYCQHSCYVETLKGKGFSLRGVKVEGVTDPTWPKHGGPKLSEEVKRLKVARYLHENRERIIQMLAERKKTA